MKKKAKNLLTFILTISMIFSSVAYSAPVSGDEITQIPPETESVFTTPSAITIDEEDSDDTATPGSITIDEEDSGNTTPGAINEDEHEDYTIPGAVTGDEDNTTSGAITQDDEDFLNESVLTLSMDDFGILSEDNATPECPDVDLPSGQIDSGDLTDGNLTVSVTADTGLQIYAAADIDSYTYGYGTFLGTGAGSEIPLNLLLPLSQGDYVSRIIYAVDPLTEIKSEPLSVCYYWPTGTMSFEGNTAAVSGSIQSDTNLLYSFNGTSGVNYTVQGFFEGDGSIRCKIIDTDSGTIMNGYGYGEYIDWGNEWPDTGFTAETTSTHLLFIENYDGYNPGYEGNYTINLYKGAPAKPEITTTVEMVSSGWGPPRYEQIVPVTITTDTGDAEVWYNIYYFDSMEEAEFTLYTGPFNLMRSASIEAYAKKDGIYSTLSYESFTIFNPIDPVFNPIDPVQPEGSTITVTAEANTTVYYTTDGSNPSEDSPDYFTVGSDGTVSSGNNTFILTESGLNLKAIVVKGGLSSGITHVQYIAGIPKPVWLNQQDSYNKGYQPILNANGGGTIYYTIDGTDPAISESRQVYTAGAITIDRNTRLRAVEKQDDRYSGELSAFIGIDDACELVIGEETSGLLYSEINEYFTVPDIGVGDYIITVTGDEFDCVGIYGPGIDTYISHNIFPYSFTVSGSDLSTNDGALDLTVYPYYESEDVNYTVKVASVFPPLTSHGTFNGEEWEVSFETLTEGASVYYTTDGITDPTTGSALYTGEPISVPDYTVIKAIAVTETGETQEISDIVTVSYPIDGINISEVRYNTTGGSYFPDILGDGSEFDGTEYYISVWDNYSGDYDNIARVDFYVDYNGSSILIGTDVPAFDDWGNPEFGNVYWETSITLHNGPATFRAIAYDSRGNSQTFKADILLNTAPVAAPTELSMTDIGTGYIDLVWNAPADLPESGTVYYEVFCGTDTNTADMELAGSTYYIYDAASDASPTEYSPFRVYISDNYSDTLYYAVRAYINEGRYSIFSDVTEVDITDHKDVQAPSIEGIEQYNFPYEELIPDGFINENIWYRIIVSDNVGLKALNAYIRPYGEEDVWTVIDGVNSSYPYFAIYYSLPDELADGRYVLKVIAEDIAGNSTEYTHSFYKDTEAPAAAVISNIESLIGKIRITFESDSADVDYYVVRGYYTDGETTYYQESDA